MGLGPTQRLHSYSNPQKELLWSLWVGANKASRRSPVLRWNTAGAPHHGNEKPFLSRVSALTLGQFEQGLGFRVYPKPLNPKPWQAPEARHTLCTPKPEAKYGSFKKLRVLKGFRKKGTSWVPLKVSIRV